MNCDQSCPYRGLYSGAQASLTDMAARHAGSSSRVGRLRQGLIKALQMTGPKRFADIERDMGVRMSKVDDETLLAAAQHLMEPLRDEFALAQLRASLAEAGFGWAASASPVDLLKVVTENASVRGNQPAASATTPDTSGRDLDVSTDDADKTNAETIESETTADEPPVETPGFVLPPGISPSDLGVTLPMVLAAQREGRLAEMLHEAYMRRCTIDDLFVNDDTPTEADPTPERDSSTPSEEKPAASRPRKESIDVALAGLDIDTTVAARPATVRAQAGSQSLLQSATPMPTVPPKAPAKSQRTAGEVDENSPDDDRFSAACLSGIPTFEYDLTELCGSSERVTAWNKSIRGEQPKRFVLMPGKERYKLRGSLYVPTEETRDVISGGVAAEAWVECLRRLRGSMLIEAAAFLHDHAANVESWEFMRNDRAVFARAFIDGDPVGFVLSFIEDKGSYETDCDARTDVIAAVEKAWTERLSHLVVLSTHVKKRDELRDMLNAEHAARGWTPSTFTLFGQNHQFLEGSANLGNLFT